MQRTEAGDPVGCNCAESDLTGPCWMWTGSYFSNGYGQVWWKGHGRPIQAHRLMYMEMVGPIPDDLQIDHLCRVQGCVNPAHLRVVTSRENILAPGARCIAKANAEKTHCAKGHAYDEHNTYRHGNKRYCRICKQLDKRARRLRDSVQGTIPTLDAAYSSGTVGAVIPGISPAVTQRLNGQR